MLVYENKDVPKIKQKIKSDAKAFGQMPRFGYFSIAYGSHVGDQFYSASKKPNLDSNRKLIMEKRNVFTSPIKHGKSPDVFFSNMFKEDKAIVERQRVMAEKDAENALNKAKSRKKGAAQSTTEVFRPKFKPTGPTEYTDLFDLPSQRVTYKVPVYSPPPRRAHRAPDSHNMIIEKRGIFTNPPKHGNSSYPGILFGVFNNEKRYNEAKKLKKSGENHPIVQKGEKKAFKLPFKPASLMKCEPFNDIQNIYGEEKNRQKSFEEQSKLERKSPRGKFKKKPGPGCIDHAFAFKPANVMLKSGENGFFANLNRKMFNIYGVPFIGMEKNKIEHIREKRMEEKKAARFPFKNNLLMNASMFSPAISSFTCNLKKEFSSVFKR